MDPRFRGVLASVSILGLVCVIVAVAPAATAGQGATLRTPDGGPENWPHFRGPDMTAVVADDPQLPETWSTTDNVAWTTPIPGLGWSSPIVWGDKVFLTSVVADEDYEGPSPGLYLPATGADTPPNPPPGTHH